MRTATKPVGELKITEAMWSRTFKALIEACGYRGYHTWMSKFSEKGFPDWTICNPAQKRIIFVELKSETGKLSKEQIFWGELLQACGIEWYCWRPSDYEIAAKILMRRPNDEQNPPGIKVRVQKSEERNDHDTQS